MTKYILTIGLNDKDTERQEISTQDAKNIIAAILIDKYNIFAFTLFDCSGVYKMSSTNNIIFETSLRVEIASDNTINDINNIITELKTVLNQESIMLEINTSDIYFK